MADILPRGPVYGIGSAVHLQRQIGRDGIQDPGQVSQLQGRNWQEKNPLIMMNKVFEIRRFNRLKMFKISASGMNYWYFLPYRRGIVLDKPKTFLSHFTIHGFVQFTLLKEQSNEIFDP